MEKQDMAEMIRLTEKAKKMDKLGNSDAALEIYLEILDKYEPHLYINFERPAILLEKNKRYEEALEICEKALELIQHEIISGDGESCKHRIEILNQKINPEGAPKDTKTSTKPKSKSKKTLLLFIAFVMILVVIGYIALNHQNEYEDVYVDTSEMERKSELEGDIFKEKTQEDLPEITQSMIDVATQVAQIHIEVTSAGITVNKSTVGIAIFVTEGTNKSKCESIAEETAKALAGAATATHLNLTPPTPVSLGGLYKEYDLIMSVGTDSSNIIAKGTKTKSAKKVNWRK